ncbi:hypothetical protein Cgig2_030189 [Carnegiea gigantea]|uniref:Uncharacterized protein n=1 Tax=Carnegiea gigantea TaxID=171969 RepID=A0A9Q1KA90_9CARY|nr:hypothetical protein Cgig2_030189 [Carnegiea gigantea]
MFSSSSFSSSGREIDPLLKDLSERKQSFRKNVVSLAAELNEVRTRLALQEQSYAKETQTRQACCSDSDIICSTLTANFDIMQYLGELDDLRTELTVTKVTADASAASAQLAQMECLALVKDLDEKNNSIKQLENRVKSLAEQLDRLQEDLQVRESSQRQLKDEVQRVQRDIMESVVKAGVSKDLELRKALNEVSPKNFEETNRLLSQKDQEIAKLRDEIKVLSTHWKLKTQELETQLEKHRTADQELKKRVLKLEFCLQESRSQARKLQRMGERRDKAIKELKDQLATKRQSATETPGKRNFWDSSSFKILVSMSIVVLVVFARR